MIVGLVIAVMGRHDAATAAMLATRATAAVFVVVGGTTGSATRSMDTEVTNGRCLTTQLISKHNGASTFVIYQDGRLDRLVEVRMTGDIPHHTPKTTRTSHAV
eukprot:scaffold108793_cov46-Attheya_sp.AAC.4